MGLRGPPRTPTSILRLRGSQLAKRRERESSVQAEGGRPTEPVWLNSEGKREWKRTVRALGTMKVLSRSDRSVLAGLCQAWSTFVALAKAWNRLDPTEYVENRALRVMISQSFNDYRRAALEFGLTPASRSPGGSLMKPRASTQHSANPKLIRRIACWLSGFVAVAVKLRPAT